MIREFIKVNCQSTGPCRIMLDMKEVKYIERDGNSPHTKLHIPGLPEIIVDYPYETLANEMFGNEKKGGRPSLFSSTPSQVKIAARSPETPKSKRDVKAIENKPVRNRE